MRKPIRRMPKPAGQKPKPRLQLKVSRALQAFNELPEGALTLPEQTVLRRVNDILTGAKQGVLKETDFQNLLAIAKKHRIRL